MAANVRNGSEAVSHLKVGSGRINGYHRSMLRVYCDFNDRTEDDLHWLLFFEGSALADAAGRLGLRDGDRVLLFQDADDFEVEATLHFNRTDPYFAGTKLCALPDWSTARGG